MKFSVNKDYLTELFSWFLGANIGSTLVNLNNRRAILKNRTKYILNKDVYFEKISMIPSQSLTTQIPEILIPYFEKITNYVTSEDLKFAYNNVDTLKIKRNVLMLLVGLSGRYSLPKNKIKYSLANALGHEFLHYCSTTISDKRNIYYSSGFSQQEGITSIGSGIDEGYTELLASRLFNKKNKVTAYGKQVKLAKMIELFFEKPEDMLHLYFSGNLLGLIHQLEQFAPRKEVLKLIFDIDYTCMLATGVNPIAILMYIKTQLTLYNWFITKVKEPEKIEQMNNLINDNKLVEIMLKNEKIKLCKNSPYKVESKQKIKEKKS